MSEKLKNLRKKAMSLPLSPGVYIMKNKSGEIIYIGKAKALKNRVSQYFGSQNNHPQKVRRMVENVFDFEYIITDSEFEALILECSLIKQHSPKYNILLKDDKGYSYIRVTDEPWRRISYVLQKSDDGATYIGPYKNSYYVKNSVEQAQKIFKLPTCNRRFPQDFKKGRPCLNFHIKQCCAPCTGRVKLSDYNEYVEEALGFLKGGDSSAIRSLTDKMLKASDNLDYERAAKIRDQIEYIKRMRDKQKVVNTVAFEQDIIAFASDNKKGCFEVFRFSGGRLFDRESFFIDDVGDENAREQFLLRYYTLRHDIPKNVVLDSDIEDKEIISQWLSEKRGNRVYINVPQRGEQKHLVDMCLQNAYEALGQQSGVIGKQYAVLENLRDLLGLTDIPYYIESYDISNTSGDENVAGMVVFENGMPKKSAYKKFKIKTVSGQDDYGSMAEVIERRFNEYFKAKESGATQGFGRMPDLILLDGGKGQVSAVKSVLKDLGLEINVFGMVKDDHHRTRAIVNEDGEIAIRPNQSVFSFVTRIQDEVHRFAIGYHRQRRKKSVKTLSLTKIDKIGEKRAKELLKYFRTIENIKNASLKELEDAPSMTHDSALSVYKHFHSEDNI